MGEVEGQELNIIAVWDLSKDAMSRQVEGATTNPPDPSQHRGFKWWVQIGIYIVFVLLGQSVAISLGRLYYDKGGKSKWLSTLIQLVGFPVILPLYYILPVRKTQMDCLPRNHPLKAASVYIFLGLYTTAICMLYSIGLMYLPVSTFSLICASQLAFNALFAFFLNSQKFTPYIVNALVLLTISSALLVFNPNNSLPKGASKSKYNIGFICAVANSAGYGLQLSLTQLTFNRILKRDSFKAILDMIVYPASAASVAAIVGLFASGEWWTLKGEMDRFELGKVSYLMTLIWIALSWQLFTIGLVALIVNVSSLFSNVIATFGLPIVPVLAVVFFHDSMDGIKVVAMLLAIWGFVSYAYHQYLDHHKARTTSATTM